MHQLLTMNALKLIEKYLNTALVCCLLVSASGALQAEPSIPSPPPVSATVSTPGMFSDASELLGEKGLLTRASQLRNDLTNTASDLVMTAMGFLGVPYKRGGTQASEGFDCSGFVRSMFEQSIGLVLPRRAEEQARATAVVARDDLRPGDLVFFNTMRRAFSHVGIYVGDGKFIHAPRTGARVRVEDMRQTYWTQRFNGARRVNGAEASLPVALERHPHPQ